MRFALYDAQLRQVQSPVAIFADFATNEVPHPCLPSRGGRGGACGSLK
jgi:hypothetical protein